MRYPPLASLAKAARAAAVSVPVMGLPWPPASTVGSSRASRSTDSRAARRLQVVHHGGPERPGRPRNRPDQELSLKATKASPVIRTRSRGRKYEMWPGVWPGVGMHSQPGKPGTPPSVSNVPATSPRLDRANTALRHRLPSHASAKARPSDQGDRRTPLSLRSRRWRSAVRPGACRPRSPTCAPMAGPSQRRHRRSRSHSTAA